MKTKKLFIVILILSAFLLSGCSANKNERTFITSIDELSESKIGVETGTIFDDLVKDVLPDCTVEYFNNAFDITAAVDSGKISAFACDEPFANQVINEKKKYTVLTKLSEDYYGFVFQKNNAKSDALCEQINEFIAKARQDGTIDTLNDIWFGFDNEKKDIDYTTLTAENGTLKLGTCTSGAGPFAYIQNGKMVGYEIDLAVRFCREYGYGIEVIDYEFSGLVAAVSSGKIDFGASCISITEERKEQFLFSDPSHKGGIVLVVCTPAPQYSSIDELQNKRFAVITGSAFDKITADYISGAEPVYFGTSADLAIALNSDKADFYVLDEPVARLVTAQYPNQTILGSLADDSYGIIFKKDDEKGDFLCRQVNEYLSKVKADGSLDEMINAWFGADAENRVIDYDNLSSENGVLTYAISTNIGAPYVYVSNGKYAGYEVEFVVNFCREYGYGINFFDTDFAGLLSAVSLGKADLGSSGISITEERKESILFSDPIYDGGITVVVKNDLGNSTGGSFFESVKESFEKTFIRENRWKMFLSGIGTTMLVTLFSAAFGSLLGFLLFLVYRKKNKIIVSVLDCIGDVLEKLPVIVILMILYYVVFGSSDVSGAIVSVIGFTALFSFNIFGLIKTSVNAVDFGQTEAALALGYTDGKAFLRMIFPQSIKHLMPGYKSSLVSLIKDTAIVGYIAVQDLTKVSDVVRSRTYEPFFPLISTALIYFLLALMLITVVRRIEITVDPRRRKSEKILKGVKMK